MAKGSDHPTMGGYLATPYKRHLIRYRCQPIFKPSSTLPKHYNHHANNVVFLVLVAGVPLDQKVVQYGPFVLNTQEQVYQAMLDYQSHSNGFERAAGWKSEIGKSMLY